MGHATAALTGGDTAERAATSAGLNKEEVFSVHHCCEVTKDDSVGLLDKQTEQQKWLRLGPFLSGTTSSSSFGSTDGARCPSLAEPVVNGSGAVDEKVAHVGDSRQVGGGLVAHALHALSSSLKHPHLPHLSGGGGGGDGAVAMVSAAGNNASSSSSSPSSSHSHAHHHHSHSHDHWGGRSNENGTGIHVSLPHCTTSDL